MNSPDHDNAPQKSMSPSQVASRDAGMVSGDSSGDVERVLLPEAREASPLKRVVQVLGFLAGLGLLAWCIMTAFKPENRAQLERLADAPAWQLAVLALLNIAYIGLNAAILWATVRPVRLVPMASVQAVHAVCVLLSYLPFKLSVVFRVIAHARRDGVPVLTIGAWLASAGGATLGVLGVLTAASAIRQQVDAGWVLLSLAGLGMYFWFANALCRLVAGERGLEKARALADRSGIGLLSRVTRSQRLAELHGVFDMQAHRGWFAACIAMRVLDVGVQASRFWLAAHMVGTPLRPDEAVMIACTYFLIGVLSPTGALGAREAGTAGLAGLVGLDALAGEGASKFVVVTLAVSASESIITLALSGLGIAYLRPDRWIERLRPGAATPSEAAK